MHDATGVKRNSLFAEGFPSILDGIRIREEWGEAKGDNPAFHRLCVRCPLSHGQHHREGRACGRKRHVVARNTNAYGPAEVIGFLGVWLQEASSCRDAKSHIAFRPSRDMIYRYLVEKNIPIS